MLYSYVSTTSSLYGLLAVFILLFSHYAHLMQIMHMHFINPRSVMIVNHGETVI